VSDSGYDLTLIKKTKTVGMVEFFDTGIKVQPDFGWYFDVVARSSLTKTGYMVANAVGVIDRTYTGSILVPLIKIDQNAAPLTLPATVVQMIPRPIVHAEVVEVETLDDTERGAGGFGSTGR
jgi:dUTP pyrophosphatase